MHGKCCHRRCFPAGGPHTLFHEQLVVGKALAAGRRRAGGTSGTRSLPDFQLREAEQMAGNGDRVKSKHPQSNEQSPRTKCAHLSSRSEFQLHIGLLDTTAKINNLKIDEKPFATNQKKKENQPFPFYFHASDGFNYKRIIL